MSKYFQFVLLLLFICKKKSLITIIRIFSCGACNSVLTLQRFKHLKYVKAPSCLPVLLIKFDEALQENDAKLKINDVALNNLHYAYDCA